MWPVLDHSVNIIIKTNLKFVTNLNYVESENIHQKCFVLHQFVDDVLWNALEGGLGGNENRELIAPWKFDYSCSKVT